MSQTILIEPEEKLRKIYALNLHTYAATDVVDRESAEDAIALLSILPSISLIVCRAQVGEEDTAMAIHNFLQSKNLDIPMIVLGECPELAQRTIILESGFKWEDLVERAAKILGVTEEEVQKKAQPTFIPIDVHYFYDIEHTPCDVYIRIKKNDNTYQFVKRLRSQDSFTQEDIRRYEMQGLTHFYLPKDFQQYFVNYVTNSIVQELERDDLELGERLLTNSNAYEIVKERIAQTGLDEAISHLADSCIQSMVKSIQDSPTLATLLRSLFSNKVSYAYQHAHLLAVVGDFILSRQNWYEKKHLDLFTLVSFFSDITLPNAAQIKVNSQEDLDRSELTAEQKQAVLNHAADAAEIIKEYPAHTPAIQDIIMQHHGEPEGFGFAANPSDQLHPLSKVFIVADAFVKTMLDPDMPKNKKDILSILYAQFTNPSYQKIIKVLEQKMA